MAYEVPVTSTARAPSTSSTGSAHALAEGGSNGGAEGGGGARGAAREGGSSTGGAGEGICRVICRVIPPGCCRRGCGRETFLCPLHLCAAGAFKINQ
jgi:hypothetical protein